MVTSARLPVYVCLSNVGRMGMGGTREVRRGETVPMDGALPPRVRTMCAGPSRARRWRMTADPIGPPTQGFTCAYAPDIDVPACSAAPDVHFISESEAWGMVALFVCFEHAPHAAASGYVSAAHTFTEDCKTQCTIGSIA